MSKCVGAGREPPLIEGHQEADRACPAIVSSCCGSFALPAHEPSHFVVKLKLGTIDSERNGTRYAFGNCSSLGYCNAASGLSGLSGSTGYLGNFVSAAAISANVGRP
jgi:hypothetical protein